MFKKIISFGVLAIMLFSLTACGNGNGLQKQIDELEKKIGQQADRIEQQADMIADLENENEILSDMIAGLEKEKSELANRIADLEKEKMSGIIMDSWEGVGADWHNQVEVSIVFPRIVKQGDPFLIKVTTTNISDADIVEITSSTMKGKGVLIWQIMLQSENKYDYELYHDTFRIHTSDNVQDIIPKGESDEYIWELEGTAVNWYTGNIDDKFDPIIAPKGVYDIWLHNGEIFRNAIEIV